MTITIIAAADWLTFGDLTSTVENLDNGTANRDLGLSKFGRSQDAIVVSRIQLPTAHSGRPA
jgi:hypothetical protein